MTVILAVVVVVASSVIVIIIEIRAETLDASLASVFEKKPSRQRRATKYNLGKEIAGWLVSTVGYCTVNRTVL